MSVYERKTAVKYLARTDIKLIKLFFILNSTKHQIYQSQQLLIFISRITIYQAHKC